METGGGMEIPGTGFEPFSQLDDRGRLTHDEFLQLLLTQMATQNPLEPMDDEKMLNQMLQLQQMDVQDQMSTTMATLSTQMNLLRFQTEFTSAAGLIGKDVKGQTVLGEDVEGRVTRVSVEGGQVVCWVDTGGEEEEAVPFNNILEVLAPEEEGEGGGEG